MLRSALGHLRQPAAQLRWAENRTRDRGISMGEKGGGSFVSLLHTHTSHSAGSRPSLMSIRQGCATGSRSILWLFALGWGSALQSQSQGTSKCGSHRHGCVSSSRSRKGERGRRERGLRAGPEGQRCYEVVRVHRLQQCRVCCWVPLRAVF
jgi:hypothetical protein